MQLTAYVACVRCQVARAVLYHDLQGASRSTTVPAGILTRTLRRVTALPSPPHILHQKRELTPFPPHGGQVP